MKLLLESFNSTQCILAICYLLLFGLTIFFFVRKSKYFSWSLFFTALVLSILFGTFINYLNPWDEQFHALVAKNTGFNFFKPQLFKEDLFPGTDQNWVNSAVWLHKQPLFTWQMAVSIKIFGNSLFAARLPSAILFAFSVIATYDIGRLILNRNTGIFAALLLLHSGYILMVSGGIIGMDHNDLAFFAYITFSLWAFFRYLDTPTRKWLFWIGFFAGCAILNKWLVGLLVFFPFGIWVLQGIFTKEFKQRIGKYLYALGICFVVFLPWQIYTLIRFPNIAKQELFYNSRHFTHVVEGHSGNIWTYYDYLSDTFFNRFDFLLIFYISLGFALIFMYNKIKLWYLISVIFIVYFFFTLAQTKLIGFTIPAYASILLIIAIGFTKVLELVKWKYVRITLQVFVISLLCNWMINFRGINNRILDTGKFKNTEYQKQLRAYMATTTNKVPKSVIFGHSDGNFTSYSWMYYQDDLVYAFYPLKSQVLDLIKKGYKITIIQKEDTPVELQNISGVRYKEKFIAVGV